MTKAVEIDILKNQALSHCFKLNITLDMNSHKKQNQMAANSSLPLRAECLCQRMKDIFSNQDLLETKCLFI